MTDTNPSHPLNEYTPSGPHPLPRPPIPKNVDLRNYPWMKLNIQDLLNSDFWRSTRKRPDIRGAALALWTASWHQVPAGSLPDDIMVIADLAGVELSDQFHGMNVAQAKSWAIENKEKNASSECDRIAMLVRSLHRFELCQDYRRYHQYLAPLAAQEYANKGKKSRAGKKGNATRWETKRKNTIANGAERDPDATQMRSHSDRTLSQNRELRLEKEPPLAPLNGAQVGSQKVVEGNLEGSLCSVQSTTTRHAPAVTPENGYQTNQGSWPTVNGGAQPSGEPSRGGRDIDPEATAVRRQVTGNASMEAEFGMSAQAMVDAMHQACAGSTRLLRNAAKLEEATAIIALLRENPGMSFREDVLPAIASEAARAGPSIVSWAFFGTRIAAWHQNRRGGVAQPGQRANGGARAVYDPDNRPDWWHGKADGHPPPGHPWKLVIDKRTGMPRMYDGKPDWQWYDHCKRYAATGGFANGEWDRSFDEVLPGRDGSSCPGDILEEFGIEPEVSRPGVRGVVVGGKFREARVPSGPRQLVYPPKHEEYLAKFAAEAAGGVRNGAGGHSGPMPDLAGAVEELGDVEPQF